MAKNNKKKARQAASKNKGKKPESKADSTHEPASTDAEVKESVHETDADADEVTPAKDGNDNEVSPNCGTALSPLASEFVPKNQVSEGNETDLGEEVGPGGDADRRPSVKSVEILERDDIKTAAAPNEVLPTSDESDKFEDESEGKPQDGPHGKPVEKPEDQPQDKSEKPEDKPEDKSEDKPQDQPQERPAKISKTLPIKHPLRSAWTLWYLNSFGRGNDWEANLKKIYTVSTVEDFWSLWNHIPVPTALPSGSDYSFFKAGIAPMWEDRYNKGGGRWLVNLERKQSKDIDSVWQEAVLRLIGGFDEDEDVNGVVASIRSKCNKMGLWIRQCQNLAEAKAVGVAFKDHLRLKESITFESHESTQVKTGSMAKVLIRI